MSQFSFKQFPAPSEETIQGSLLHLPQLLPLRDGSSALTRAANLEAAGLAHGAIVAAPNKLVTDGEKACSSAVAAL